MENKTLIEDVAALKEQARWHERDTHEIKSDLKEIKGDIKALMSFRWKIAGAAIVVAFLATSIVEVFRR